MLEYPTPHFIQPRNFHDARLFSVLPWAYVPPALCDQMPTTNTEGDKNVSENLQKILETDLMLL